MLRSIIEDYLMSIRELQFFLPFRHLLEAKLYYDIHLVHGSTEFGKDFIAKKREGDAVIQYSFQIKVGDVKLSKFRTEVQPQLLEAYTNKLAHPNFDDGLEYRVIFVTTGNVLQPATIDFQEFNKFLKSKLNVHEVEVWEKDRLISEFITIGLEPFFNIHKSPTLIGSFFNFYSKITNNQSIDFLAIESYSRHWLDLDWKRIENRLQIFFEAYFFSKLFFERKRHYEAVLMLCALIRCLVKNRVYQDYQFLVAEHINEILESFFQKFDDYNNNLSILESECRGFFSIFYYPANCLKSFELFSLYILTNDHYNEKVLETFADFFKNEKGAEHPLSDNYAVSIVLISLALLKLKQVDDAKKFLNNVTIWLCNRYENLGLCGIGVTEEEEIEQLLSEYLTGYTFSNKRTSFIANIILDLCYLIGDGGLYADIANELKAVSIIPEFYHVLDFDSLFTYDHPAILSQHDSEFSLELKDNYSPMIEYERRESKLKIAGNEFLYLTILLRDRYFPILMNKFIE